MRKHADARSPLKYWLRVAQYADWRSLDDVRKTFGTAKGGVPTKSGQVEVFKIHGNNYRLIVKVIYAKRRIVVMDVLTHREYDNVNWKQRM